MASDTTDAASAPAPADAPLAFTLQIVSPSIAAQRPLAFSELPMNTTVRQLKEKIREKLDTKPSDQTQRLIHRGRLLQRDNETLLDIFGEENVHSSDAQTLHLVLRDLADTRPANTSTTTSHTAGRASSQPPPATGIGGHAHQHPPHVQHQHQFQHPFQPLPHLRPGGHLGPNHAIAIPQAPIIGAAGLGPPQPPTAQQMAILFQQQQHHLQQQQQQQHHQHQHQQWRSLADMQAENNRLHELFRQHQRERTAMGLNGAQDTQTQPLRNTPGTTVPGSTPTPPQPDATRTVVREGLGPNGQQWRITVNESISGPQTSQRNPRTGSPLSGMEGQNLWQSPNGNTQPRSVPSASQLSGADVQNIIRTADAGQATRIMSDAMRRHTSTSSLANLAANHANQPIPPGVTTPLVPTPSVQSQSRTGTPAGMPDLLRPGGHGSSTTVSPVPTQLASGNGDVYILWSPEGPRGLLINGSGTYVTPPNAQSTRPLVPQRPFPFGTHFIAHQPPNVQIPQRPLPEHGWAQPADFIGHNPQNQAQPQPPAPAPRNPPRPPQAQHHVQRGHAAAHPHVRVFDMDNIWPHIWMITRLALFVWWFTSPNSSWQRWLIVLSIAIVFFLGHMGVLTPLAEQIGVPIRRHVENLMPLADGHGRNAPLAGADGVHPAGANVENHGQQPIDPANTAARLVQQRREANTNWLMTQVRRLERAGILFLASIAPGVAERHIANVEAEARAERHRREEAAAAAEAARAQADNGESAEGGAAQEGGDVAPARAEPDGQAEPAREDEQEGRRRQGVEPLIAI